MNIIPTVEQLLEIQTIATELKTGEEVPWNRIIRAFETISNEKNVHRNYKAYKIVDYYKEHREEITKLFLDKLQEQIEEAKRKCGKEIK